MKLFGEAVYEGKPCGIGGMGRNFVLKGDKCLYLFCYDLGKKGNDNVTVGGQYSGAYAFGNVKDCVKSIKWMDNDEQLEFNQKDGTLAVNLTGTPYGTSYCVRVAKAEVE